MITTALVAIAANLLFGLLAIPQYIRLAKARSIIDQPNERSSHTTPTPRGGGIFIGISSLATIALISTTHGAPHGFAFVLASFALTIAIGFTDDLKSLPSLARLGGHFLSAIVLILGLLFPLESSYAELPSLLYWTALVAIAIWIVGCLNIYNFMDGIDGIASLQGLTAAVAWIVISIETDSLLGLAICTANLGAILAFLVFNWAPAKVFMGDGASGYLGLSFAVLPIVAAQSDPNSLWTMLNIGALCLFPFLFDGSYTLLRRAAKKENILQAHRSHLYQRWVQSGKSHRFVATNFGLWSALCALAALFLHFEKINFAIAYAFALTPGIILLAISRNFPKH